MAWLEARSPRRTSSPPLAGNSGHPAVHSRAWKPCSPQGNSTHEPYEKRLLAEAIIRSEKKFVEAQRSEMRPCHPKLCLLFS